jgi:hypothetical protein
MKKVTKIMAFLFLAGTMTTATVSCSSDDGGSSGLSKSWKIDGKLFKQAFCVGEEDDENGHFNLYAMDESMSGDVFFVQFPAKPTSNRTYNLKNAEDFENGDVNELAPNEAVVVLREMVDGVEMDQMIKNSGATISVTVSGGKVSVTLPETDAYRYENHGDVHDLDQLPVVKVEGNIVETGLPGGPSAGKMNIKNLIRK